MKLAKQHLVFDGKRYSIRRWFLNWIEELWRKSNPLIIGLSLVFSVRKAAIGAKSGEKGDMTSWVLKKTSYSLIWHSLAEIQDKNSSHRVSLLRSWWAEWFERPRSRLHLRRILIRSDLSMLFAPSGRGRSGFANVRTLCLRSPRGSSEFPSEILVWLWRHVPIPSSGLLRSPKALLNIPFNFRPR